MAAALPPDEFAELIDASWLTFRQQLLAAHQGAREALPPGRTVHCGGGSLGPFGLPGGLGLFNVNVPQNALPNLLRPRLRASWQAFVRRAQASEELASNVRCPLGVFTAGSDFAKSCEGCQSSLAVAFDLTCARVSSMGSGAMMSVSAYTVLASTTHHASYGLFQKHGIVRSLALLIQDSFEFKLTASAPMQPFRPERLPTLTVSLQLRAALNNLELTCRQRLFRS